MTSIPADIFTEPSDVDDNTLANLGPLRRLAGVWEGRKGVDINPKADGPERREFVERIELQPIDPQANGPQLLYGLREALTMLHEEGLARVFARHDRHAEATRRAVRAWGLELLCLDATAYSSVVTAVLMPAGHDEVAFRKVVLEHFNMSLGSGLGKVAGKVFRIGHLGDFNDLTLAGTLAGVEMGLQLAGVPHQKGGVAAALDYLTATASNAA